MRIVSWTFLCLGLMLIVPSAFLMGDGLFHLGVTLPVFIGGAFVVLAIRWQTIRIWCTKAAWRRRFWVMAWIGFCIWMLTVAVFFAYLHRSSLNGSIHSVAPPALIVLGAGSPKCEVSPTLRARLNVAYEAARQWKATTLVVSGGKDLLGRPCTEAEVMRKALVAQGIAAERILLEDRSTSTAENFEFSKTVLQTNGISVDVPIAFVTNGFHGPRAMRIGMGAGFSRLEFLSAQTPIRYRYHAWLREYFASLSSWMLREG